MEYFRKTFCLEVRGDFACFTRPEMKVERVSYDVITPSAARGIFEAIFWKPAIRWQVTRIEVLNEIRWTSMRRNEVKFVVSNASGYYVDEGDNRQQRAGLLLRDVAYRLHAEQVFLTVEDRVQIQNPIPEGLYDPEEAQEWVKGHTGPDENPGKYNAMFERRARKGQCFHQPYLGTREFACSFRSVEDLEKEPAPIDDSRDLGFMLYDMVFPRPTDSNQEIQPTFYRPRMNHGVIEVPSWDSVEVRR